MRKNYRLTGKIAGRAPSSAGHAPSGAGRTPSSAGRKRVSIHTFCIYVSISVKFSVTDLHVMTLTSGKFRDNSPIKAALL